jgi:hypothetical protein
MRGLRLRPPLPVVVSGPVHKREHDECCRCLRWLPWTLTAEMPFDEFPDLLIGAHKTDGPICGECFDRLPPRRNRRLHVRALRARGHTVRGLRVRPPLPIIVHGVQVLILYKDCIACKEPIPWEQLTNDNYPLRDDDLVLGPYCASCVVVAAQRTKR